MPAGADGGDGGLGAMLGTTFSAPLQPGQVADTMEQAMTQSHASIVSAILSGSRALTITVNLPELDPFSRGYNETSVYVWSSSVAVSMASLALASDDAPVKVIVQDINAAAAAAVVYGKSEPAAQLMQQGRLVIRTLSEAKAGDEIVSSHSDAAVLLVAPTNSKQNKVTKEVRNILLGIKGKLTVVLNQCLDAVGADGAPVGSLPVELRRFEEVYHIQAWALQGRVQERYQPKDAQESQARAAPKPRRVVLTRVYPALWSLYAFQDDDQRYELLQTMEKKPSERLVLQICARALSPKRDSE